MVVIPCWVYVSTGKVPGMQLIHDCIPKRFTTNWHSDLGCTMHYSLSVRFILATHFLRSAISVFCSLLWLMAIDGNGSQIGLTKMSGFS